MSFLGRICAAAFVFCPIVLAVPAGAASRLDPSAPVALLTHDVGPVGGFQRIASHMPDSAMSAIVDAHPQHASDPIDTIPDVIMPVAREGHAPLTFREGQPSSEVPLPTGFSLFGAAILTLGLLGLVTGAQRQPVLQLEGHADRGVSRVDKSPAAWFRIEVAGEQGRQVRHTGSARGAIDLIADLLNEGWDVVRISDRDGMPIDYDDVIRAWRAERPGR